MRINLILGVAYIVIAIGLISGLYKADNTFLIASIMFAVSGFYFDKADKV